MYNLLIKSHNEICWFQVECGSFGLLILTFFLSFVFLYFWSEAQNDYNDFDWWVSFSTGIIIFFVVEMSLGFFYAFVQTPDPKFAKNKRLQTFSNMGYRLYNYAVKK